MLQKQQGEHKLLWARFKECQEMYGEDKKKLEQAKARMDTLDGSLRQAEKPFK